MATTAEFTPALCMACSNDSCNFAPVELKRRPLGEEDVEISMKFCGVCHSDLHTAAGHLMGKMEYPCVPGHELAGVCVRVGSKVTRVKVGQHVGVGCMVDSCLTCAACLGGDEQKCSKMVGTYQGSDNGSGRAATFPPNSKTLGGYTSVFIVHERFAIIIPDGYPLEFAGPVMCAGITMYDPLVVHGVKPGDHVGVVGLGGLGQMGARIAKAMGCTVSVISRSAAKRAFALECGADNFVCSSDAAAVAAAGGTLDLILNTVPTYHDYLAYQPLLRKTGKQVLLGLHDGLGAAFILGKVVKSSRIVHSGIGGIKATQAVIDLCAKHAIYPKVEIVPVSELNRVYAKLDADNESGVRYVLDIANTLRLDGVTCGDAPALKPAARPMRLGGILAEFFKLFCCCHYR